MKKIAFYTLGCKVNQYETNAMSEQFIKNDYEIVKFEEFADIYVINTCTVTNMADRKSRQIMGRVKSINSQAIIVITGCYAQIAKDELLKNKDINIVIGNTEKSDIVKIVEKYLEKKSEQFLQVADINKQQEYIEFGTTTYTEKTRAVIKIQDGCNNFCSYCLIPYARGRIRSRNSKNIINEINQIVNTGIKEVVLTGIHIASYGLDLNNGYYLIDLLEDLNKIEKLKRIRLGSLEPKIITQEFVDRLKKLDKICDHFHLSLQSGCNETLKRMNRKYTCEEFKNSSNILKKAFPNVALTTDIIVGFPGETKEEFETTYNFLKEINFAKMHIFKYSKRIGTRACSMSNQVDGNVKEERSQKLIELSNENENKFILKYIGKKIEVLFEQKTR